MNRKMEMESRMADMEVAVDAFVNWPKLVKKQLKLKEGEE